MYNCSNINIFLKQLCRHKYNYYMQLYFKFKNFIYLVFNHTDSINLFFFNFIFLITYLIDYGYMFYVKIIKCISLSNFIQHYCLGLKYFN